MYKYLLSLVVVLCVVQAAGADTLTLPPDSLLDMHVSQNYGTDTANVYGQSTVLYPVDTLGKRYGSGMKCLLGQITGPVTVDSVLVTIHANTAEIDLAIVRVVTEWIEGNLDGAPIAISGDSGATWNSAKIYYSGEGTEVNWSAGSFTWADVDDNSGSYYGRDTTEDVAGRPAYFSGDDLEDLFEGWINGTLDNYGFALVNVDMASNPPAVYSMQNAVAGNRWTVFIEYTESGAAAVSRRRKVVLR